MPHNNLRVVHGYLGQYDEQCDEFLEALRLKPQLPYLLIWKDERQDSEIREAVRLAHCGFSDLVELKRSDDPFTDLVCHLAPSIEH